MALLFLKIILQQLYFITKVIRNSRYFLFQSIILITNTLILLCHTIQFKVQFMYQILPLLLFILLLYTLLLKINPTPPLLLQFPFHSILHIPCLPSLHLQVILNIQLSHPLIIVMASKGLLRLVMRLIVILEG